MIVIGLTGPSGAGKGYICRLLAQEGIPSLDTDQVARAVCEVGQPCLAELRTVFGDAILQTDGTLNRGALAGIVFADPAQLARLNAVTHKYIRRESEKWLDAQKAAGHAMAVIDAPVLFESGFDAMCDCTVGVLCDRETRISRILARDSISREAAEARINAQPGDTFYLAHCDYIIENGAAQDPALCVRELIAQIGRRYGNAEP